MSTLESLLLNKALQGTMFVAITRDSQRLRSPDPGDSCSLECMRSGATVVGRTAANTPADAGQPRGRTEHSPSAKRAPRLIIMIMIIHYYYYYYYCYNYYCYLSLLLLARPRDGCNGMCGVRPKPAPALGTLSTFTRRQGTNTSADCPEARFEVLLA